MEEETIQNILAIAESEIKQTVETTDAALLAEVITDAEDGLRSDMLGFISSLIRDAYVARLK